MGPGGKPLTITYNASPWSLTGLSFINLLLNIITLGIYRFWGKTQVRNRIWSAIRINDEPLEYTGTGKELFLGFLVALFLVLLPFLAVVVGAQIYFGPDNPMGGFAIIPAYIVLGYLFSVAFYSATRYRLSRTLWRGIRGSLVGSPWGYGRLAFFSGLLIPLTIGWIMPWRSTKLQNRLVNTMQFGQEPFHFAGSSKPLYGPFSLLWIGGIGIYALVGGAFFLFKDYLPLPNGDGGPIQIPQAMQAALVAAAIIAAIVIPVILAFIGSWYYASLLKTFASYTTIDKARFHFNVSTWGLIGLILTNLLIALFSFGILAPVIQARTMKFMVDRLTAEGTVDADRIAQSQQQMTKTGEGMATFFDIDIF